MMPGEIEAPPELERGSVSGIPGLDYSPLADGFDEMVDASGTIRAHWLPFHSALGRMGLPELIRNRDSSRHLIREHGITYNVYGDPRGRERPWQLDPVPLLVSADEAAFLEPALIQRARLLELILSDIYGPQRLLTERLVPLELVFGSSGFLRPCHGIRPVGNRFITIYAANLARSRQGGIFCLGDRAQAPSGAGYALENRIILSRTLPEVFRELRVQRLALFFQTIRDTLRAMAPLQGDNPRIVLLTPGPYNETYFEHAFLARYLGYTLVEGADLTVRDSKVYLKLLEGLQPVDVILRRLDDDFCDPLELRGDSYLGVQGLMQAAREGNIAIANALGSGLVESSAWLPFLPRLCRYFLGEDLRLPSVPTWWCGEPQSLQHVLASLERMVVKSALGSGRFEPVFGDRLSVEERKRLAERIASRPCNFAAQEITRLATAPVLVGDRLVPRPVVLRAYLAARSDGTFALMPGGLTRFSGAPDGRVVSMQSGGGSKDTWLMASGPVSSFSLLPQHAQPLELSRAGRDLPSRSADNLFWLGRYAERAEGLTRLLRGIVLRLAERSSLAEVPELPALLGALPPVSPTVSAGATPTNVTLGARLAALPDELVAIISDRDRSGSLASVLELVKRIAGTVRDRISIDMWRVLGGLEPFPKTPATGKDAATRRDSRRLVNDGLVFLDRTVLALAAFGGLASESMTRGAGWRFLDMGRRLERCLHTVTLLGSALRTTQRQEGPVLEAVLEIADSSMTYSRRYLGHLQAAAVLDLLLLDKTNPRSLVFQLLALAEDVRHLPKRDSRIEETLVLDGLATLRFTGMEEIAAADAGGLRSDLSAFLKKLLTSLSPLSELITERYLSHLEASRHLGGSVAGGRE